MTYSYDGLSLTVDHDGLSATFELEPHPSRERLFCVYERDGLLCIAHEPNRGTFDPARQPHNLPADVRQLLWVTLPACADSLDHEGVRFEDRT